MSIVLEKGATINLSKESKTAGGLKSVRVLLEWLPAGSPAPAPAGKKPGFFSRLLGSASQAVSEVTGNGEYDLDAGARIHRNKNSEMIYYGNLKSNNGEIKHSGDDLTGAGEGEEMNIYLDKMGSDVTSVEFFTTIYQGRSKGQLMKHIHGSAISIFDNSNNKLLCKYNLNEEFGDEIGVRFGELHRNNGDWEFQADGSGVNTHLPNV